MDPRITAILHEYRDDPTEMGRRLVPVIHASLKRMAVEQMAHEGRRITLQPTALVNEAYIRLIGSSTQWQNRRHSFGAAAEAMRRIAQALEISPATVKLDWSFARAWLWRDLNGSEKRKEAS